MPSEKETEHDTIEYRPSGKEPFMNARQREYFRRKLLAWKTEIVEDLKETLLHLQEENQNHPDLADRASSEAERAIEPSRARLTNLIHDGGAARKVGATGSIGRTSPHQHVGTEAGVIEEQNLPTMVDNELLQFDGLNHVAVPFIPPGIRILSTRYGRPLRGFRYGDGRSSGTGR
jgi:hypothetical protein